MTLLDELNSPNPPMIRKNHKECRENSAEPCAECGGGTRWKASESGTPLCYGCTPPGNERRARVVLLLVGEPGAYHWEKLRPRQAWGSLQPQKTSGGGEAGDGGPAPGAYRDAWETLIEPMGDV